MCCTSFADVRTLAGAVLCVAVVAGSAAAQDLEPRAYSASPVGANFLIASYARSTGGIVFDPTLPISDVNATVEGVVLAVGHSFGLFGDLASVAVAVPYAWADLTGNVHEQAASTSRSGLADARLRFAVNLIGNPAMSPAEFVRAPRRTIVGASLLVLTPSGQYYDTKLINIGNHRWAFKPEIGVSVPIRRVDADVYVAGWFFTRNDDFYPGAVERTQEPGVATQAHVSYTLRPRLWVAFDSTWYSGGRARVDDGDLSSGVNNSRAGVTVSVPVGKRYSLKVAYASGVTVRTGTNFTTYAIAWQALWLSSR